MTKYRPLNRPFLEQPLQLLYTGRFLKQGESFTGDNITPAEPECLDYTRDTNDINTQIAYKELNDNSKILGGISDILPHPVVEPEAIIEDPQLTRLVLQNPVAVNMGNTEDPSSSIFPEQEVLIENYQPPEKNENTGNDHLLWFIIIVLIIVILVVCFVN